TCFHRCGHFVNNLKLLFTHREIANASLVGKVFHSEIGHNSIIISMGMRKILNKVFATAIDNHYHLFALRDKASCFRLLTEKHDIAHIASSVF
ncbi:hypothetical protein, partial [Yersinia enterocolitica]|uniref:hypothetical protein n=3 Tax=Yersinia enterocolitica TaxID=630 RepID=UPI001E516EC9